MTSWRSTLKRLSNAFEFANIDSLSELETMLEERHPSATANVPPSPCGAGEAPSRKDWHGAALILSGLR
jgi:hypothetical protein